MGDPKIANNTKLQGIITVCLVLAGTAVITYLAMGLLSQERADRFGMVRGVKKVGGTLSELWYAAWQYRLRPLAVLTAIGLSAVAHTGMMFSYHFAVQVFPTRKPELARHTARALRHCSLASSYKR